MPGLYLDPRLPQTNECVTREVVERWAADRPRKVFAWFGPEKEWTYAETAKISRRAGNGFASLGVKQGEHVLSWLPNGPDAVRVWFGLNYLGAVYVPLNTAYRGKLLEHTIRISDARLIVVHADLAPRLAEIDRGKVDTAVVIGGPAPKIDGIRFLTADALEPDNTDLPPLERPIAPWDTQSIIFTSGTTGPSKAVLSSYAQIHAMCRGSFYFADENDRAMVNLPMFHVGGTAVLSSTLIPGGSVAMVDSFDTNSFWRQVRESQTTTLCLLGVMTGFLLRQPPRPDDKDHPLRHISAVPFTEEVVEFGKRFGVDWYTLFNMTEVSGPLRTEKNPTTPGTCGKPRPGVECRLVDENDCEVPDGTIGELILRTDMPWGMNHGYYGNPEATVKAWRNGWFHTGDAFKKDAEGYFYFVDRMKDAIRRRGENISSFEVEAEVCAHPAVREAAAIPVKNELAEDDVMVVVAPAPGQTVDPVALIEFLKPRMAHFMVPRYVRILPDLPKTPTQKVQKHILKTEGVTADTWDRDKAGIKVGREKIGQAAAE